MAYPTVMTPEVDAKARKLAAAGLTLTQAAGALDVTDAALRQWAIRKGVAFAKGQCKGRRFPVTVMLPEREAKAREMAAAGASKSETARALGLNLTLIDNWARRRGVTFTRQQGSGRHGLTGQVAQDFALARKKGFSVSEALRIAGVPLPHTPDRSPLSHGVRPSRAAPCRAKNNTPSARAGTE